MKLSIRLLFGALLVSLFLPHVVRNCLATNQQTRVIKPRVVDPIPSIRKQYAAINKRAGKYRKVKKELSGFSLEGGQLVAYFDGPSIVKIVANHYGESGRAVEEYYFVNEKLIFAFHQEYVYDRPLSGRVRHVFKNRLYFSNDQLVEWLNTEGKPFPNGIDDYRQKRDEYLETARKFLDGARSTAATIESETNP